VSDEDASHEREICEFSRYAGAAALMLAIADAGEKIACGGHRYQRHLSASCREVGRSPRRMVKDPAAVQ
jgi:hypothetical protein